MELPPWPTLSDSHRPSVTATVAFLPKRTLAGKPDNIAASERNAGGLYCARAAQLRSEWLIQLRPEKTARVQDDARTHPWSNGTVTAFELPTTGFVVSRTVFGIADAQTGASNGAEPTLNDLAT